MNTQQGSELIKDWPEESQEAAQLVIDQYGEPQEVTDHALEKLRFTPGDGETPDPDSRVLSDEDLERAQQKGEGRD